MAGMSAIKSGIYPTMTMPEYLAIQAFSSGLGQRILSQSPLHAWVESPWNPERDRSDSGTADIGTYAHAMLLEGGSDALWVVEASDWRTKAAQQSRDDARAMGKTPILFGKLAEVNSMVKAAKEFIATTELAGLFDAGAAEQTLVFEIDGVLCKARPDWLTTDRKISLSYKTTAGSAQPDAWIRTQLPGYDMGIVLYERGIRTACDVTQTRVVTLVQEQKMPFSCALIGLAPAWQELADKRLSLALGIWASCLQSGKFPGYTNQICWAEPKPWMMAEAEEQELNAIEYDPAVLFGKPTGEDK